MLLEEIHDMVVLPEDFRASIFKKIEKLEDLAYERGQRDESESHAGASL
jgi:hypothetical protein